MNTWKKTVMLLCLLLLTINSHYSLAASAEISAKKSPIVFENRQTEQDYQMLAEELRCPVCQNQNLIDSNSGLANDLRHEVARLLKGGKDKQQVKDFMVTRYGDFILYQPPIKPATWMLWGGPFLLMFLGLFILLYKIKNASEKSKKAECSTMLLSAEEKKRVEDILENH